MVIALWAGGRQIETDRGYPFQFASFTEAGRLDADVKRIIASSSSWT
jgi:hypothetical protein